jgi:ferredoxin
MKIVIDRARCVGLGKCVEEAPTVFDLDSQGKAVLLDPDSADREHILAAARACPLDAITIYEDDGKQIFP